MEKCFSSMKKGGMIHSLGYIYVLCFIYFIFGKLEESKFRYLISKINIVYIFAEVEYSQQAFFTVFSLLLTCSSSNTKVSGFWQWPLPPPTRNWWREIFPLSPRLHLLHLLCFYTSVWVCSSILNVSCCLICYLFNAECKSIYEHNQSRKPNHSVFKHKSSIHQNKNRRNTQITNMK